MSGSETKFPGLKVGDKVVICRSHRGVDTTYEEDREVLRIGRKYFAVRVVSIGAYTCEEDYSLETGLLRGSRYSEPYALSMSDYAVVKELRSAKDSLRNFGIDLGYHVSKDHLLLIHRALMSYSTQYANSVEAQKS